MVNQLALEFTRYVLRKNPQAKTFGTIYDAMSLAASHRAFRNLGREELSRIGVSFSLLSTGNLDALIKEGQRSLACQPVATSALNQTVEEIWAK